MVLVKISLRLISYPKVYHLAKKNKLNNKKIKINNNGYKKITKMKF